MEYAILRPTVSFNVICPKARKLWEDMRGMSGLGPAIDAIDSARKTLRMVDPRAQETKE